MPWPGDSSRRRRDGSTVIFSEEQRFASLALFDDAGWVVRERGPSSRSTEDLIFGAGAPSPQAVAFVDNVDRLPGRPLFRWRAGPGPV